MMTTLRGLRFVSRLRKASTASPSTLASAARLFSTSSGRGGGMTSSQRARDTHKAATMIASSSACTHCQARFVEAIQSQVPPGRDLDDDEQDLIARKLAACDGDPERESALAKGIVAVLTKDALLAGASRDGLLAYESKPLSELMAQAADKDTSAPQVERALAAISQPSGVPGGTDPNPGSTPVPGLPKEDYAKLRKKTPSQAIRDRVNQGVTLPMDDPALPSLEITSTLHADHIVPMKEITQMPGFAELTEEHQLQVLNNEANFVGLSEIANTSKGAKSFEEWTEYKKLGIKVDEQFRQTMIKKADQMRPRLQGQIAQLLAAQRAASE
ncbi:MAG TPA: hypothetical protein VF453_15900 [Burkholderiaceae bacterium]